MGNEALKRQDGLLVLVDEISTEYWASGSENENDRASCTTSQAYRGVLKLGSWSLTQSSTGTRSGLVGTECKLKVLTRRLATLLPT